jgi:hypothetical protein
METENDLLDCVLQSDASLGRDLLEYLIRPYKDEDFIIPKVLVLAKLESYSNLAATGLPRLPLLSVINGAEMVAYDRKNLPDRTKEIHSYAYSPAFAEYANRFKVEDGFKPEVNEQHFFVHGIAKALSLK